ncbi:Fic family protein [Embleya sp. NPDC005575]|uniref:Fic family protein n=1 Tax=Embleya sp. NPDC005575 TaxID=3156892 RepID=UPI0033A1A51B
MHDDLALWRCVRQETPWPESTEPPPRGAEIRDGVTDFIATVVRDRDPERASRLGTALNRSRTDAARGAPLSFALMEAWQRDVLALPTVPFRDGPAFAKGGRERYALNTDTRTAFDTCLVEATQPGIALSARAVRAYLDVVFFHPFPDGNGRAAMLALDFVLTRDQVRIDAVGPLFQLPRQAGDADGALAFVRLLTALLTAPYRRRPRAPTRHAISD